MAGQVFAQPYVPNPIGLAFGNAFAQGYAKAQQDRLVKNDTQSLLDYIRRRAQAQQFNQQQFARAAQNANEWANDVPGQTEFDQQPGMATQVPPMQEAEPLPPTMKTPEMRRMLLQMELGRIMSPIQKAQMQNLQSETEYNRARSYAALNEPGSTPSVQEQLHQYALMQGYRPGTPEYDRITKGFESTKPSVQEQLHQAALAAGYRMGTPEYSNFIKGQADGMTQSEKLTLATGLRKEFDAAQVRKDYATIERNAKGMQDALQLSLRPGFSRVASDQALAVQFQKMLDPTSVVRESEYARTPEGVAILNRLEGGIAKLSQGGLAMSDSDRSSLVEMANKLLEGAKESMNKHIGRYTELADLYGVDKKLIFGNIKPFDIDGTNVTDSASPVSNQTGNSRSFRGKTYTVGETISGADGKQYTVTGFDENGTPMVDEVK